MDKQPVNRDVLSPDAAALLAAAWVALFGGRWALPPLLEAAHLVTPEQVSGLDRLVLDKVYLVLLCITIVVAALRVVRSAGSKTVRSNSGEQAP